MMFLIVSAVILGQS